MIHVGNYERNNNDAFLSIKRYSISNNIEGEKYTKLIPDIEFSEFWQNNKQQMNKIEAIIKYTRYYYKKVLKKLDVYQVIDELTNGNLAGAILLSNEKSSEFSHRTIIAEWIELQSVQSVYEVNLKHSGPSTPLDNEYRKIVNKILEKLLQKDLEMHDFKSTKSAAIYNRLSLIDLDPESEEYKILVEPLYRMIEIIENKYKQNNDHKQM